VSGNFSTNCSIPTSTPFGAYSIGLRCGGSNVGISATLRVTAAPPVTPVITVSPTSAQSGESVTISGVVPPTGSRSCPSADAAQLTSTAALFPPDGFGPQVSRDARGKFQTNYTIPTATAPGTYNIGVRCGGGNVGISATLQVPHPATTPTVAQASTVPAATTAAPTVGRTSKSSSSARWIGLGALVLFGGAGAALLFLRRRGAGAPN